MTKILGDDGLSTTLSYKMCDPDAPYFGGGTLISCCPLTYSPTRTLHKYTLLLLSWSGVEYCDFVEYDEFTAK